MDCRLGSLNNEPQIPKVRVSNNIRETPDKKHHNKDYGTLRSILGCRYVWKLPNPKPDEPGLICPGTCPVPLGTLGFAADFGRCAG